MRRCYFELIGTRNQTLQVKIQNRKPGLQAAKKPVLLKTGLETLCVTVYYVRWCWLGVTLHVSGRSRVGWAERSGDQWTAERTFFDDCNQIIRNRLISKSHAAVASLCNDSVCMSAFSYLRTLTTRHCPHSPATAAAAVGRFTIHSNRH